ncbi:synaptotagmin-14 isoform X2 [Stigmatopora nigra]
MASDITSEAVGFLSAVGVLVAALALVFLYINKTLCFSKMGGAPCTEQQEGSRRRAGKERSRPGLGGTSSADDNDDDDNDDNDDDDRSSSDSDNREMSNFEISVSRSQTLRTAPPQVGGPDHFSHSSERRDAGGEPSDSEDRAVVQVECHGRRPDESRGVPEGPSLRRQYSLEPMEEGPAPSAPELPTVESEEAEPTPAVWEPQDVDGDAAASPPQPVLSKCCDLLISLEYRASSEKLLVTVASARDLPQRGRSGGATEAWQVRLVLLPAKKQRRKTWPKRAASGRPDVTFGQTFALTRVEASRLAASALRFRVYALEGRLARRRRMMGEKLLPLAAVDRAGGCAQLRLLLEPRADMKSLDSESSLAAEDPSPTGAAVPELLVGLSYSAATGRMSVEIIKGSCFGNAAANRPPDTFARLTLLNSAGQEMCRCRTSLRRSQPNPVYKESFAFQVALFQLSDVTLTACVYGRRGLKRKEMIGWAALGRNASGREESLHWRDMRDGRGTQVRRWHVLLPA